MTKNKALTNRTYTNIKKELEKGENIFILHGEYIHDIFFYDLYLGCKYIRDTLKHFFLQQEGFDYFFAFKKDRFEAFNSAMKNVSDSLFKGKETKGDDSDGLDIPDSPIVSQKSRREAEKNAENAVKASADDNLFLKAIQYCKDNKKKRIAFFFEDLEWTAGLYKQSTDDALNYVEKLKELMALQNTISVVSIENEEMLKQFNFRIDGKNTFMVGSPSSEEIYDTFLRAYIRSYGNFSQSSNFFEELKKISEAMSAGEKSLRDACSVFELVLKRTNGVLKYSDFEAAFDKPIEEKVELKDVILDEKLKKELKERCLQFIESENPENLPKGFILSGPPGTGKTYLVKALANELNCQFLSPSLADLKGEYVGQTAPKVKKLFQKARANEPTIIFIDEADTIFPSRDAGSDDTDSYNKDMVNQFLVEMDGLGTGKSKVLVIAATNRVETLDSAIKSRLSKNPIKIDLPDKVQRELLFEKYLEKENFSLKNFSFKDELLDKTESLAGRDIKTFCNILKEAVKSRRTNLEAYKNESDAKTLFFDVLKIFESNFAKEKAESLGIKITSSQDNDSDSQKIIGYEIIKKAFRKQASFFDKEYREKRCEYDIKPKKGILLYGPPGNAKSKLAEAMAKELSLYFAKVTSDAFKVNPETQNQKLKDIFDSSLKLSKMASYDKGVMLFFDEFDSLAGNSILDPRVRGTMLTQLDDSKAIRSDDTKILFVAATNFYERLDEAMTRTGRIDEKFLMDNPDEEQAAKMLCQFIKDLASKNPTKILPLEYEPNKDHFMKAYSKLKANKNAVEKQKFRKDKMEKWELTGWNKDTIDEKVNELYEEKLPSGSDVQKLAEQLIEIAFENGCFVDGKLTVNANAIDSYCEQSRI